VYEQRCSGCHSLDANRVGPAHRGVHGRRAGTAPAFAYSDAVRRSGIVWNDATLDRWLANPQALIPGQRMNFRIADPRERADVIAYLKRESAPAR
jgi:cytochrome c